MKEFPIPSAPPRLSAFLNLSDVSGRAYFDDGCIPNSRLPLLFYRHAVKLPPGDAASAFEQLFELNGWSGTWRNGIYPYHHYHSTAHEVLGIFSGSATVQLGGERGGTYKVNPGDVIILPAGVGHRRLWSSKDFGVVGAYPDGQEPDLKCGEPGDRPRADQNIAQVPLPNLDPIYGEAGPLCQYWR